MAKKKWLKLSTTMKHQRQFMIGYFNTLAKFRLSVPLVVLLLLPTFAYSDSELPTNVDPRPSEPDLEQLISILRSAPENGWVRVNNNQFRDVWPPKGLLVSTTKAANSEPWEPHGIISAFSGFTWDSRRGDLIIYGGGHAAYGGNELYRWRGTTLEWERMSLPSDISSLGSYPWQTVDGPSSSPQALHTYDSSVYLPIADRFMTFGGAGFNFGEPYLMPDPNGPSEIPAGSGKRYRLTGPYFFDPARADQNKVGGKTGSHSKWNNPNAWVIGGEMWENRDIPKSHPAKLYPRHFLENSAGYTQENGKDVVYIFGQQSLLSKYTVNDVDDPTKDGWENVGWGVIWGQGAGAYLPTLNLFVRTSKNLFTYWNLSTPSPTNPNVAFVPNGNFVPTTLGFYNYGLGDYGMDYDAPRNRFLLWGGGGDVWALTPPPVVSPNGWNIQKLQASPTQTPSPYPVAGILGKWKYIAQIDAFIALDDKYAGNIWIYKPENWVEPISNDPHITIAEPSSRGYILPNEDIVVTAITANPQSNIAQVELLLDGQTLATLTEPPYTTTLPSVTPGVYTFEAIATDGNGTRFISPRVAATVANHVNNPPSVSLSAPLDGSSIEYFDGRTVTLRADASDSDGNIAKVEFFLNGNSVGADNTAPHSVDWEAQVGSHMLTAVATDNTNMTTASDAIELNVTPPGNGDLIVLQDGLGGYSGTTDTYLDGAQTTYPKGGLAEMNSIANLYNPLVRFAIFSNEGGPVPQGSIITYAALALYKSSYYDYTYRAHPLLVNWVENKATWINAADGIPWNAPGAAGVGSDYAANSSPAALTGWNPDWVVLDVTDSVQAMSLGTQSNFGWQLLGNGVNYHKIFRASEYTADPKLRPKLILQIGNKRPAVALKAPKDAAIYAIGDPITLNANANDSDGSVTQVEFFYNNISLGVATTAPYTLTWTAPPLGKYALTAVATDNAGASATSTAVTVYSLPPGC
jgi:Bacterial Ig domain